MTTEQVSMDDWTKEVEKRLKGQTVSDLDSKHLSGLIAKVLYVSRPEDSYGISKDIGWVDIPIEGYAALGVASNPHQPFVTAVGDTRLTRVNAIGNMAYQSRVTPINWHGEQLKSGLLHLDPWALQVRQGNSVSVVALQYLARQHGSRPITIDTTGLVLQGATPVDELSWVLSTLTEWHQFGLLKSLNDVWIHISLDALLFENVAKCRALRKLLDQWCIELKVEGRPFIQGESTLRMFTLIDPNVNLLRTTIAAIGGIWGGVDGLSLHPYDVLQGSTTHSRRIATNIHRVLAEESGLGQWMDPLEGSYAVEHWTEDFCEMAWSQFVKDESTGGLQSVIDAGTWNLRLTKGQEARTSAIQQGKVVMTGVNKFANALERLDADWLMDSPETAAKRDSEDLERFRVRIQNLQTPLVKILCLAPLSKVKRQVDMVTQFLATMGWTAEAIFDFDAVEGTGVLCLCGLSDVDSFQILSSKLDNVRCILTVGTSLESVSDIPAFTLNSSHPNLQLWSDILMTLQQSSNGVSK